MATRLGVVAWADSGQPAVGRWQHLQPVIAPLERERAAAATVPSIGWDAVVAAMSGSPPSPSYGRDEVRWQQALDNTRTGRREVVDEDEHRRKAAKQRERLERTGRSRR